MRKASLFLAPALAAVLALPAAGQQQDFSKVEVKVVPVAGKISIPFAGPYCASKHALEAIADALRVEVAPFGIRVVIVEPGPIETRFDERARSEIAGLVSRPGPYAAFYELVDGRRHFRGGGRLTYTR